MAEYLDNAAGITTSTGVSTSGLVISNSIDQYGPIIGAATDGATYPYYIKYVDVADGADYETGQGTWDAGTTTLTSTSISTSSNSGSAVNWGPGQKAIFITADASLSTDMENMVNGATKLYMTTTQAANIAASKTKTDLITVTQAVDLDQMEADIAAFASGMTYKGNWDASVGTFPGGGTANIGDFYYVNVTGTVDSIEFTVGDNIVALTNNASISTFAGNWSKHDQTDAVQSVAGLVGTITEEQLRDALHILDPWIEKPAGEPFVIVFTGQSNCTGVYPEAAPSSMPVNNNVFSLEAAVAPQTGPFAFSIANPMRASGYGAWPGLAPFTGMVGESSPFPGQPTGNTGWTAATYLQQVTGRDVYIITVHWSGEPISRWLPGGACQIELSTRVNAALALVPSGPSSPDIVIWSQGETDAGTRTPSEYAADWNTVKDNADSDWSDVNKTRWFITGFVDDFVHYPWQGLDYTVQTQGPYVQFVSAEGPLFSGDTLHFSGSGYTELGRRTFKQFVGMTPSKSRQNASASNLSWKYGTLSDVVDGSGKIAFKLNTPVYSTGKLFELQENGTARISVDASGNTTFSAEIFTPTFFSKFNLGSGDYTVFGNNILLNAVGLRFDKDMGASGLIGFTVNMNAAGNSVTASGAKLLDVQNDGTSVFAVDKDGYLGRTTILAPTITHTSSPPDIVKITGTEEINYSGGPMPTQISLEGTFKWGLSSFNTTGGAIYARNTYTHMSGATPAILLPSTLLAESTFTTSLAGVNPLIWNDIASQPILTRTSSGTASLSFLTHYTCFGQVLTGTTVATRTGFSANNLSSLTGTLTSQVGFVSTLTSATNNTHVLLGTNTVPSGNYAIYQSDTLVNRWGGGHRLAYRASNATSITMTVADHVLKVTTTSGPVQVDLPTAAGNTGLHYIIKRTGTQNVVVEPNGSETIDGVTNKTIGTANQLLIIVSDGANWLALHEGAP